MHRLALLAVLFGACATTPSPEDPFDTIDPSAGGGADGAGFPVLDVECGERLQLEVAALPAGASLENVNLANHIVAVRVHGGAAAVIARRTTASLDPAIIVKDLAKHTVARSDDQVVLPGAASQDAMVFVASAEQLVMISGEGLTSGGTFTLDVVALPAVLDHSLETTPARIIGGDLQALETERAAFARSGWIVERADGGVDPALAMAPIDRRVRINAVVAQLRDDRAALFAELSPEQPSDAARDLAAVWAALAR